MRESWSLLLNPSFLAKATGTKVVTVRYCEQAGLLPAPPRTCDNYRTYGVNRPLKTILVPALCAGTFLGLSGGFARAAEPAPTPPPTNWWDTLTVGGFEKFGFSSPHLAYP